MSLSANSTYTKILRPITGGPYNSFSGAFGMNGASGEKGGGLFAISNEMALDPELGETDVACGIDDIFHAPAFVTGYKDHVVSDRNTNDPEVVLLYA